MSSVLEVGFSSGDRIGNYRVECELGPTGAGLLLLAHHLVLPRVAILKVVHSAFARVQQFVLQTLREACILEAIAHPGVPIVYESGVLKDRRPWFALEAITGTTLEELLAASVTGVLSVLEVAALVRDLAGVLEHAHGRGVIHRGLRPERVVSTPDRRHPLCIPDWSEAIAHDATSHLPQSSLDSSAHYVAPELAQQAAGRGNERVDDRVDMFALGVIAYRTLTGRLPFTLVRDAAPHVATHDLRPEAPLELAMLVDALLSTDRFDRPRASEVRAALDRLLTTLPAPKPRVATRRTAPLMRIPAAAAVRGHQDVVSQDSLRLRRPRWTPDVPYRDTTDVEIAVVEDDLTESSRR